MQYISNKIRFSPSDLAKFLDSPYASWMDRWHLERRSDNHDDAMPRGFEDLDIECVRDEDDVELQIIALKGVEHEEQFLRSLPSDEVVEVSSKGDSESATYDALNSGAKTIFQAHLVHGQFGGYADFLMRVPGDSKFGDYHYEVADTKLAKSPKPYFIIQLCCYADLLGKIQGRLPASFEVILGDNTRTRFETAKYYYYYLKLKASFLEFHEQFDLDNPIHASEAKSFGQWKGFADAVLEATDHLSRVAKITRSQIKKLEAAGISTLTQLATEEVEHISKLADPTLRKLQWQSRLQLASAGKDRPLYEVIESVDDQQRLGLQTLPPESENDVFFDMEGYPLVDGGLEYLFGATHFDGGEIMFSDWWAHDSQQEKLAFEGFIDWVHARWKSDRTLHIYHYADYEVSTLNRLMGKYATREKKVDDLLRNKVFVDLYKVVRQGVVVGTPSYSLKYIERLYMDQREGEVTTSGGSIVAYHHWLESKEAQDWQSSEILKEIRDYNEVDCVSTWKLAEWLRDVQQSHGIQYIAPTSFEQLPEVDRNRNSYNHDAVTLADRLVDEVNLGSIENVEQCRIQSLLAGLLEFHWREAKPVFWRKHAWAEMTDIELIEDQNCLGSLVRIDEEPERIKRSFGYRYRLDAPQQTKLRVGSKCLFTDNPSQDTEIVDLDRNRGEVKIKLGPSADTAPERLGLMPKQYISAKTLADSVYRYVDNWSKGRRSQAIDDLIERRAPNIANHDGGSLVSLGTDASNTTVDLVCRMQSTVLCVQGPPGTGKTFTAAKAIIRLLQEGKRIAITANGHKTILNVLREVQNQLAELGEVYDVFKVGGFREDAKEVGCKWIGQSKAVVDKLPNGPALFGGTAWVFSREELTQQFDYLFVDEAGQFSLANVVATGGCASNIVLVGDQMQLASPVQGSHPGESGLSALEYFLDGRATVPPQLGVLLNTTWRMHQHICSFISDSIYDSRLCSHPATNNQRLHLNETGFSTISKASGIQFVPVFHEDNSQGSPEEVDMIGRIYDELLETGYTDFAGERHGRLEAKDILVVAPFSYQVRQLQKRLGQFARVGTVDKFQGQQAQVVLVSMCSSTIEDSPRGAEFLLNKNRLNVAISRARALAVVVGNPQLGEAKGRSIKEMELANLFCRLLTHGDQKFIEELVAPSITADKSAMITGLVA